MCQAFDINLKLAITNNRPSRCAQNATFYSSAIGTTTKSASGKPAASVCLNLPESETHTRTNTIQETERKTNNFDLNVAFANTFPHLLCVAFVRFPLWPKRKSTVSVRKSTVRFTFRFSSPLFHSVCLSLSLFPLLELLFYSIFPLRPRVYRPEGCKF